MKKESKGIQNFLKGFQEEEYQKFNAKLIPNLPSKEVLGVRTPILRKLAEELYLRQAERMLQYMTELPHRYLEENHLHAFLIENIKDFSQTMEETEKFLPYINNWATCDTFSPKIFKKYPLEVYEKIKVWLQSTHEYTVRYGIGLLLSNYLEKHFQKEMLELVANIQREEYYIHMMIAWYFATALAKQWSCTLPYLEQHTLEEWTHNKAIQKAIESRRITEEQKEYLRTLKRKTSKK